MSDPIGRSVQYAYDGQGNLATVTDPEGGKTGSGFAILTICCPVRADSDVFRDAWLLDFVGIPPQRRVVTRNAVPSE